MKFLEEHKKAYKYNMSVSRLTQRSKQSEPILMISFELNRPTRPTMTIYENSNISALIEQFVKAHKLKSSAAAIIENVINKNLRQMRQEQELEKSKLSKVSKPLKEIRSNKEGRQSKLQTIQKSQKRTVLDSNKQNLRNNPQQKQKLAWQCYEFLSPKQQADAPVLCQMLESAKSNEICQQVGMTQLQQEFDRQFKTIRTNRMLRSCQRQLSDLYQKLTRMNPPDCKTIDPDYIDFSSFESQLLDCLQRFFSRLEQQDFVNLNYDKFRELIENDQNYELVLLLSQQSI